MSISRVQTMHLGHQSLKSIILFIPQALFGRFAQIPCASDTFFMSSTILFFSVASAPTTTGITTVFICHILCISYSRYLFLLFFSISFRAMFLSDGTVISISFQMESTGSLTTISGMFAVSYSSVSIDRHVPYDSDVVFFIVHHSLWLVLVPFVCSLDIMILTDAPMELES